MKTLTKNSLFLFQYLSIVGFVSGYVMVGMGLVFDNVYCVVAYILATICFLLFCGSMEVETSD